MISFLKKSLWVSTVFSLVLFFSYCGSTRQPGSGSAQTSPAMETHHFEASDYIRSPITDTLTELLKKNVLTNFKTYSQLDDMPPYYMAYRLNDTLAVSYTANKGGELAREISNSRFGDVELRIGDTALDNTHAIREQMELYQLGGFRNFRIPLKNPEKAMQKNFLTGTDYAMREAKERYHKIIANIAMRPAESDSGTDFSFTSPVPKSDVLPDTTEVNPEPFFDQIKTASNIFRNQNHLMHSQIRLNFRKVTKRFASSENLAFITDESLGHIGIYAETKARDGMHLWLSKTSFFRDLPDTLPSDSLTAWGKDISERLLHLRNADVMETYVGPVILKNLAAGVFVHEVLGHRVEGHRQKAVDEGQTFINKIGKKITNPTVSIYDDPTISSYRGNQLNGFFAVDDQAVVAKRVDLVKNGIFNEFLLDRSLIHEGQPSNGHGRGELGSQITSRMGNTILETSKPVPFSTLRKKLIGLAKKAGLDYGLMIHEISGGYTYTTRNLPQSFKLEPLYVTRIWVDGRPDEVVRGVDLVGTPLGSFEKILAVGDDPGVFNGYCGAESGWVPVSAVSPSLLLESMEMESKAKDQTGLRF